MPMYQVTACELVYVHRTYEVEADGPEQAGAMVHEAKACGVGELVDEQMQDSYSYCHVVSVHDEDGEDVS